MNRQTYDTIARVLLHSFLLLAVFQIFAVGVFIGCGEWVYATHSQWFPMSREAFTITIYALLGLLKIASAVLFLAPWIAMRLNAYRVPE